MLLSQHTCGVEQHVDVVNELRRLQDGDGDVLGETEKEHVGIQLVHALDKRRHLRSAEKEGQFMTTPHYGR